MQNLITFDEYVDRYISDRQDNSHHDWAMEYVGYVDAAIEQDRQERNAHTTTYDDWEWDR